MRSIHRILVAIKDPYARSPPALMKAAQLSRALNARLELFHAMTWPLYATPYLYNRGFAGLQTQVEAHLRQRLKALAERLKSRGRQRPLRISVAAEWDMPPYDAVIRRALSVGADMIIAEPHHARRFLPLLHFNDWELLRRSPVPVLLIKRRGRYLHPVVLAAVDPRDREDRRARLDNTILDLSQSVAGALGGKLHTVHAYAPLPSDTRPTHGLDPEMAAALNRALAASAQPYAALLRRYAVPRRRRHLLAMPPAKAIEQTARATLSAIVTVGVLSRHGWRRLQIGRTAETLLDQLSCDLLVVKPLNFKLDITRRPSGPRYVAVPLTA